MWLQQNNYEIGRDKTQIQFIYPNIKYYLIVKLVILSRSCNDINFFFIYFSVLGKVCSKS